MERVQKILAHSGYCSRRAAEKYIEEGLVTINGTVATLGDKASLSDVIKVDGKKINSKEPFVYFLLNKPKQTVSTAADEKERSNVVDLIKTRYRIYPVGRLDYDTTGALLLTNDGELTNKLTHPSKKVLKTYLVTSTGRLFPKHIEKLETGITLDDGYKTAPAKAKLISYDKTTDRTRVRLTIHEGKNRQVRRMYEALGFRVHKLHRESFGPFTVTGMPSGQYTEVSANDVKFLKAR